MNEIKEELNKISDILVEDFSPLAIILFGSYARNTQNDESDIDIGIIANKLDKKIIFYEKQKIEEMISKDIDLVNLTDENISEGLRYEILMNGIVLYCLDSFKFDMYKLDMFREYLELSESRQDIINRVKKGGTIYGK